MNNESDILAFVSTILNENFGISENALAKTARKINVWNEHVTLTWERCT